MSEQWVTKQSGGLVPTSSRKQKMLEDEFEVSKYGNYGNCWFMQPEINGRNYVIGGFLKEFYNKPPTFLRCYYRVNADEEKKLKQYLSN